MDDRELLETARQAVDDSYAPYSEYRVGAALETDDGTVYTGCNIENANYSNSIHAEELALSKAIEAGHRSFERIAVSSSKRDGITPCGMCRQSLREFCDDDLRVICENEETPEAKPVVYTLGELIPNTISPETLE
ncbi:cytidine deaminase [Natronomonas halophila]|uniref:cytidine deaminase n=1 Tax=Natronomonas halophila TaxID=2747817 RepID=UPI0015B5DB4B|nr:cytidine deaminase [Natronomonas halophila]QLD84399.1 cytidine deaminase [Natronomonas halophila]